MTDTKWTSGPWTIERSGMAVSISIRGPYSGVSAWAGSKENAHLIAAAPDLYEALEAVLQAHAGSKADWFEAKFNASSALAKARGDA